MGEHIGTSSRKRRSRQRRGSKNPTLGWDADLSEDQPAADNGGLSVPVRNVTILISFIFLALLIAGGVMFMNTSGGRQGNQESKGLAGGAQNELMPSLNLIEVPETTLFDVPPITVAKNFAMAESTEERLKWVRKPELIRERLDQYTEHAKSAIARKISPVGQVNTEDLEYIMFFADFNDGSRRVICVVGTDDGPKVDWDSYARHCSESWEKILAGEVEQATVRVAPNRNELYTYEFADREKWMAYTLDSVDVEDPLYGYAEIGSEVGEKLARGAYTRVKSATLDIKINKDSIKRRQVEIVGFRGFGWVLEDVE